MVLCIHVSLCCVFAIVCNSMAFCTFNCTFTNSYSPCATTLSSLASFYIVCASTKWWSSASSSFNSSIHTGSIDVVLGLVCFLACQRRLLMHKTQLQMLQLCLCLKLSFMQTISSHYAFPSTHSKDFIECGDNLTTNGWIFNIPLSTLLNSFLTFVLLNNSSSSSCLHMCSLICASFSLTIRYSFSITPFALILMWTPKFQKRAQLQQQTQTTFDNYPFFTSLNISPITFIFSSTHRFFNNTWSLKLIQPIIISLCPLYNHVETLNIIIMSELCKFHLLVTPHP